MQYSVWWGATGSIVRVWVCPVGQMDHLLQNLLTMAQNSSKEKPSLEEVLWLMDALCIISRISSSLRFSCSCFTTFLNSSKSTTPFSSLSYRANTFLMPSLVLVSPTREQMISRNSGKAMGLFLSRRPWMRERMKGLRLSRPSSSRILLISEGSMVPEPSSSKTSKVCLRSSQSSGARRSFQENWAGWALAGGAGWALAVRLI